MADLFLHMAFARRLRTADGLHPLVGEALARRAGYVCFGAALAQLPQHERQALGFFRKLFGGGGEAARWQKLLAPPSGKAREELIAAVIAPTVEKAADGEQTRGTERAPGSMQRLALALGLLSHDLLEAALAGIPSATGPERTAIERAQARLWIQAAVPNTADLEREWRPAAELAEADGHRAVITHLDRALFRAFRSSPGEAVVARWMKRLAAEIAQVADVSKSGGLPVSLTVSDGTARTPHFDDAALIEKTQAALTRFVLVANRVAEQLIDDAPPERVQAQLAVALGINADVPTATGEIESARARWREWLKGSREAALLRGRNPKPAFELGRPEDELPQRAPSATGVMTLADLPPEAGASGAPPLPEMSGPLVPPPTMTQEVSVAQIEAETQAMGFQAPPHTQEISSLQIESAQVDAAQIGDGFDPPPHTQEVSVAQIEGEARPSASTTQPISAEDILLARAESPAEPTAAPVADPVADAAPNPVADPATQHGAAPANGSPAQEAKEADASVPTASEPAPTPAHTESGADGPPRE